jgi:diguanylate cyclase (GGDEF)-like protein
MALVMADLDDFRLVNDLYGHQTGDSVLQSVSEVLRRSVREADLVGRYGGEEFVILLSGTDSDEARRVMERMRGNIEGSRLPGNGELRVTVSAGIALFPEDALDLVSLIRKADRAAYLAKRTGKNRVCFYEKREIHG